MAGEEQKMSMRIESLLVVGIGLCGCTAPVPPPAWAELGGSEPCERVGELICGEGSSAADVCEAWESVAGVLPADACRVALGSEEELRQRLSAARVPCDNLLQRLCGDLGEDSEGCRLAREQTPAFPGERCSMMLEQYDAVLAELKCLDVRLRPVAREIWTAMTAPDAPSFGPPDARVTLVVFSDFQCPFCGKMAASLVEVRRRFEGRSLRVVFRQFPLSFHEHAQRAAEASLAAHAQSRFWEFHDLLFENQAGLGDALFERAAADAGLDVAAWRAALESGRFRAAVEADQALAETACVQGTPTAYLNGETFDAEDWSAAAVCAEVERALVAAGDSGAAESSPEGSIPAD